MKCFFRAMNFLRGKTVLSSKIFLLWICLFFFFWARAELVYFIYKFLNFTCCRCWSLKEIRYISSKYFEIDAHLLLYVSQYLLYLNVDSRDFLLYLALLTMLLQKQNQSCWMAISYKNSPAYTAAATKARLKL